MLQPIQVNSYTAAGGSHGLDVAQLHAELIGACHARGLQQFLCVNVGLVLILGVNDYHHLQRK